METNFKLVLHGSYPFTETVLVSIVDENETLMAKTPADKCFVPVEEMTGDEGTALKAVKGFYNLLDLNGFTVTWGQVKTAQGWKKVMRVMTSR